MQMPWRTHPAAGNGSWTAVSLAYGLSMVRLISFAVVVVAAGLTTWDMTGVRYARRGQIECAWKSYDSPGRWRHGLATVSRGSLEFQPRLGSMGTRIRRAMPCQWWWSR